MIVKDPKFYYKAGKQKGKIRVLKEIQREKSERKLDGHVQATGHCDMPLHKSNGYGEMISKMNESANAT